MTIPTTAEAAGRVDRVSLIVAVRNEADSIAELLSSIEAQSRPPDEVVIVDGGSTDGTPDLVRSIAGDDHRYQVVEAGPAGPGRGRNVGRLVARHEWLAFTDGGIRLDPRWLEALTEAAAANVDAEVVFGTYDPQVTSLLDRCAVVTYVPPRSAGAIRGRSVASMLIRGPTFDRIGGFPEERAAEDLIFFERIDAAEVTTAEAPAAVANWRLPATVGVTYGRFRLYSRQNVLLGRQGDWHHAVLKMWLAAAATAAFAWGTNRRLLGILPGAVLARTGRSMWQRRSELPGGPSKRLLLVLGAAGLTTLVDLATFSGWMSARGIRVPFTLPPGRWSGPVPSGAAA